MEKCANMGYIKMIIMLLVPMGASNVNTHSICDCLKKVTKGIKVSGAGGRRDQRVLHRMHMLGHCWDGRYMTWGGTIPVASMGIA
jgi:hypothetical protein